MNRNLFAIDSCELYRHSHESIFLFLVIGSEGILVQDDDWNVLCMASPRKIGEHLFNCHNQVRFSLISPVTLLLVMIQYLNLEIYSSTV
jgi:hypothetical protein